MYLFLLLFDTLADASQSALQCHEDERSALLELKQSFSLEPYSSSSCLVSWNLAAGGQEGWDCCAWDRIECDGQSGHVIGLDLSGCGLNSASLNSGSSLFRLTYLEKLNLTHNYFNFSLVASAIGNLLRLKVLDLSFGELSGQVPPEILGLTNLSSLNLSWNNDLQLKKPNLEDLARSLTKLEELHLDGVDISAPLTDMLANLSSLKSLTVSDCSLHGVLPPTISKLPNLQVLNVSYNEDLSGEFSTSLEGFASLRELDMSGCNFSRMIPAFLSNCTKLSNLRLSSNRFHGHLPSFVNLNKLTELDLYDNGLTGEIPYSIGSLALLWRLDLSYNPLTGPIPSSLGDLTRLESLYLSSNQLTGPIPTSLGNLTRLDSLYISSNQLTGPIPSSLGNLTRLNSLHVSPNQLSGPIPSSLGNLIGLESLDLSFNQLSGPIPYSLGTLIGLNELDLSFNQLSGLIPSLSRNLTRLRYLDLNSNSLTGPLPPSLGTLTLLDLSSNQLTGTIPSFLVNLAGSLSLDLSSNHLTGPIPSFLVNLNLSSNKSTNEVPISMIYLNLSHNQLTGHAPHFLIGVEQILHLDLRFNKLQGPLRVPSTRTYSYLVSNNRLSGEISPLICNLSSIEVLDLAENNFCGVVPQCLGNQSSTLQLLNLKGNNFSGVVPPCAEGRCSLSMMDFSHNQFEGPLPRSLGNCTKLKYLHLGNNLMNDKFPSWLGSLPSLRVLILRNNKFHGEIVKLHKGDCGFTELQIVDVSNNNFNGSLPSSYFKCWKAMKVSNWSSTYFSGQYIGDFYGVGDFYYSLEMTNKGMDIVYPKIFYSFTAMDLSSNNFSGEIPSSLGSLQGLLLLNLSYNHLTGHIPPVLNNLTNLESLDLSWNRLSGSIPDQLSDLSFLEAFNVSYNQLSGSIPRGKQFATFGNSSYIGNIGLCGSPLSNNCGGRGPEEKLPPPAPSSEHSSFELDWRIILMGFASGLVVGVVLGQGITIRQDNWFVTRFRRKYWGGRR